MIFFSKRIIKDILKQFSVKPSKKLGQHFLIDRKVLKKIIEAANLKPNDVILEIGPGLGALTWELADRVKKIIAVEKDPKMVEILKKFLNRLNKKNVKVVQKDALKLNPKTFNLRAKGYKIIANLPYYIVSPVIRKFLESENPPKEMVLMVQKEVAQRICAKPPHMNLLAVSVQFYAKPEIISYVSKKSFWPQPKVNSAIIKIVPKEKLTFLTIVRNVNQRRFRELFFKIVRVGFSQPRKQILNNLKRGLKEDEEKVRFWLKNNNISPTQRAETLTMENWYSLVKSIML